MIIDNDLPPSYCYFTSILLVQMNQGGEQLNQTEELENAAITYVQNSLSLVNNAKGLDCFMAATSYEIALRNMN
jgi:hypothetical protein